LYTFLNAEENISEDNEAVTSGTENRGSEEESAPEEGNGDDQTKIKEDFDIKALLPFSSEGGRRSAEQDTLTWHKKYIHCDPCQQRVSRRQQLVNWMLHQQLRLSLLTETLHTAVVFADCFLACEGQMDKFLMHQAPPEVLERDQQGDDKPVDDCTIFDHLKLEPPTRLRRLGATCLFIAAKMTEIVSPSAYDFAISTNVQGFLRKNIVMAEKVLLATLEYQLCLSSSTSYAFANAYCEVVTSSTVKLLVAYLIDLALLVHHGIGYTNSLIAAAALVVAQDVVQGDSEDNGKQKMYVYIERVTGYTKADLEEPSEMLCKLLQEGPTITNLSANAKHAAIIEMGLC